MFLLFCLVGAFSLKVSSPFLQLPALFKPIRYLSVDLISSYLEASAVFWYLVSRVYISKTDPLFFSNFPIYIIGSLIR